MASYPAEWALFKRAPGLVLGFHGCDRDTAEAVLSGRQQHLNASSNEYDWLGGGIYFWEADPWRALEFAREAKAKRHLTRGKIKTPYAIGAVIDLGVCCNLLEAAALQELRSAYDYLEQVYEILGDDMPENRGHERGLRFLDKAVIETLHKLRSKRKGLPPYQSVRAAFLEGDGLYANSGFHSRNHIQIAVRDKSCVLGYFRLPGL